VAAIPGASILELGDSGIRAARWDQLDLVSHWRRFLDDPDSYFRHLLGG
jgi:predicted ATPase